MDSAALQDEGTLRVRLDQARAKLDLLVGELRARDAELAGLAGEREQHRLLLDACAALEQLGALGGAHLFWGERVSDAEVAERFRTARARAAAFQKQLDEIEEARQSLLEQIEHHETGAFFLADELAELEEQAERARHEWVIEREVERFPMPAAVMPWMRSGEEDRRFRKTLAIAMAVSLLFALLVPWVELPLPEPEAAPEVPERLTRLIIEQRQLPPPPAPEPLLTPPEQKLAEAAPEEAKPKDDAGRGPGKGPGSGPGEGILAFRDKLAGFTQNQNLSRLGAQARIAPGAPSGPVERSMLTTQAAGSSGGINLAELSRNVSGGGGGAGGSIEGVQIARATSAIAGGGGGRAKGVGRGGPGAGRTDEEIQIVFDRHKSALYRLYNRELRQNPTLKGQMVLRLRIEPDGSVSLCELQATDMRAPQLAAQVLDRVRGFDFGAKDVPAVTILYPIDFLPAA